MRFRFRRKDAVLHFQGRKHSKYGIAATVIGIILWIAWVVLITDSVLKSGQGEFYTGISGIAILGGCIAGGMVDYKATKEKEILYHYPIAGAALNGLLALIMVVLYINGIFKQ